MARDYKSAPLKPADGARAAPRRGGVPPMVTGIIIGLLLGIALAVSIALWLNRAHNPFIDKSPPVEALPTFTAKSPLPAPPKNEKGDPDKPRFEFYQILPGDKGGDRTGAGAPTVAKASSAPDSKAVAKADAASAPVREATKPSPPTTASTTAETVYLQAGAFQSQTDAENLKAKIAFSGFEAYVRPVNLPDKGTLYRVRLGPYKSPDEVNRIKTTLSQNGIAAAVVKTAD